MENERLLMEVNGDIGEDPAYVRRRNPEPCMGGCLDVLGKLCGMFWVIPTCGYCCNSCTGCCNPYRSVNRGYRGVITRFGSVKEIVSDGLHYVNPISEEIQLADIMLHVKKLDNQTVMTKDNLPITIDGAVYYYTNNTPKDIIRAKYGVYNVGMAVDELAHSTLRLVFGQHTLQECLEKRKEFAQEIKVNLGSQAASWGIVIQDIQIIDIVLPKHIQDLLSTSAVAQREGDAEIIMAKARVTSAHMMREAADQLSTPAAMQMRMLETYKVLAESENSKIIFMPALPTSFSESKTLNMDPMMANIVADMAKSDKK